MVEWLAQRAFSPSKMRWVFYSKSHGEAEIQLLKRTIKYNITVITRLSNKMLDGLINHQHFVS